MSTRGYSWTITNIDKPKSQFPKWDPYNLSLRPGSGLVPIEWKSTSIVDFSSSHLQICVAHARTASEFKYATPFQPIRLLNLSSNPIRDGGVTYLKYLVGDNALNLMM